MKKESYTSKLWPAKRIREELRRLDRITGLHGAGLSIWFTDRGEALGSFCRTKISNIMFFEFSLQWFDDPDWPEESALHTIRHEYAHYMDYMENGENADDSHGESWQECCRKIGVSPSPYYNPTDFLRKKKVILRRQAEIARREEEKARRQREALDDALLAIRYGSYNVGTIIDHPVWGKGMVINAAGEGVHRTVTVRFASQGSQVRKLNAAWVDKNCRKG